MRRAGSVLRIISRDPEVTNQDGSTEDSDIEAGTKPSRMRVSDPGPRGSIMATRRASGAIHDMRLKAVNFYKVGGGLV